MNNTRLKTKVLVVAGQSPPSSAVSELAGGAPFLQGNAEFGALNPTARWQAVDAPKFARMGDILVSVRAPVGAVNVADSNYGIGRGLCAVRPRDIAARYLYWLMCAASGELNSLATGSTFTAVSASDIGNLAVPVTSRVDQDLVGVHLDRETAEIDAFIADQESLIELLTERRAAMITSTLTGGAEGSGLLEDLPMGWQLNRFSRVVKINEGQVDPRGDAYKDLPLIAPNHIQSKTGRLLNLETAREQAATSGKYLVDPGQVLYSKIRPALVKAAIAPTRCLSSADMYALSTRNSTVLRNEFLYWLLLSKPFTDYAIDQSARVAMPKLNHETLGAAPIWYPSVNKQARIERVLEESTSRLDATIADARESIALSRERRAALISAAVTGKIDLREHGKGDA